MEITGQDVLLVKKTNTVREYKSEKENYKGKKYRVYAFGGKGFAVHEDDSFIQDLDKGDVQRILLTVTEEGYQLENYVSWTKANAHKLNQVKHDAITV